MAVKDKVVTIESLSVLHEHNKAAYMSKENPIAIGSLSMNIRENATIGENSVATGHYCTASGKYSHAEGDQTIASGVSSHAEGYSTDATAFNSHAEGHSSAANGSNSHAEGVFTIANGDTSHTEGYSTIASSDNQHVQGKYNIEDANDTYAHIVGNGESNTARSNAHTLDWDGNAWFAGDIKADGNIVLSTNQYGDELPAAGIVGRIFFKKFTE